MEAFVSCETVLTIISAVLGLLLISYLKIRRFARFLGFIISAYPQAVLPTGEQIGIVDCGIRLRLDGIRCTLLARLQCKENRKSTRYTTHDHKLRF